MISKVYDNLNQSWRELRLDAMKRIYKIHDPEQTKMSWAKTIQSYEQIPEAFKSFFENYAQKISYFPYSILTPTYNGLLAKETEKLICDFENEILILEDEGSSPTAKIFPKTDIVYVEFKKMLLDAYLKIFGLTSTGEFESSLLRFNAVGDFLFEPFIENIRLSTNLNNFDTNKSESSYFDHWAKTNFKFMNFAKTSLLGKETVKKAVYQPEIVTKKVILGYKYYRKLAPTLVCILTNLELIIIQEGNKSIEGETYGGTWYYLPLRKIDKIELEPEENQLMNLKIFMQGNSQLEFRSNNSSEDELNSLLEHFKEMSLNCKQ